MCIIIIIIIIIVIIIRVGEKRGFWLIPNAPLISTNCAFFPLFFCSNQQKQNHSPKIPFYVCDQAQLFPADLNTPPHTFFCMRSSRTLKKSHKIPTSFSIGGVGDFRQNPLFSPTRQEERQIARLEEFFKREKNFLRRENVRFRFNPRR